MKPIIGITTKHDQDEYYGTGLHISATHLDYTAISSDYIRSVENAGGIPVMIPIVENVEDMVEYAKTLDGIIFSGGSDIGPEWYGEEPAYGLKVIKPMRDAFEMHLAKELIENTDLPILGICRGHQIINVALGGTLYQDLHTQRPDGFRHDDINYPKWASVHSLEIDPESAFFEVYHQEKIEVNSYHHQAIKDLAPGLKAVMTSPDGLVEGTEGIDRKNLYSVQWHPEMMTDRRPSYLSIFRWFIGKCQTRRGGE